MVDHGRRTFLTYTGLTAAFTGGIAIAADEAGATGTGASTAADESAAWDVAGGNPGNTGYVPAANGPEPPVTVSWTYDHDGSFAVVDGTVYLVAADGRVHAIAATDGAEEWTGEIASGDSGTAAGSPAVAHDTVYVCGNRTSPTLTAFDAATGDVRWKKPELGYETNMSPVVADGTLFLAVDKALYALDAKTGEKKWRFQPDPVTADGREYGVQLARQPVAVADGAAFALSNKKLFALNVDGGDVRWSNTFQRGVAAKVFSGAPAAANGVVAAVRDDTVTVFDAATGEERSTHSTHTLDALTDDRLYAVRDADTDGGEDRETVIGYDRETGERAWQSAQDLPAYGSPIVDDGFVYATAETASGNGGILAFDDADGSLEWSVETDAQPEQIAVVDRTLYACADGTLLAIRSEDETNAADESNADDSDDARAQSSPGFTAGVGVASGAIALEWLRRRTATASERDD